MNKVLTARVKARKKKSSWDRNRKWQAYIQQMVWLYQAIGSNPKMGKESVPETLENFHTVKWQSAREYFIEQMV
jgi:hypothetical protein